MNRLSPRELRRIYNKGAKRAFWARFTAGRKQAYGQDAWNEQHAAGLRAVAEAGAERAIAALDVSDEVARDMGRVVTEICR